LISSRLFYSCQSLETIEIPSDVTAIGDSAFEKCNSLSRIKLPDSLIDIQNRVFRECSSLLEIVIPAKVVAIGSSTFESCFSLSRIILLGKSGIVDKNAFRYIPATILDDYDPVSWKCKLLYPADMPWDIPEILRDSNNLTCIPYNTLFRVEYRIPSDETPLYSTMAADGEVLQTIPDTPGKENHSFLGWARTSDATTAQYKTGMSYTVSRNLTFYPVWKKTEPPAEVTGLKAAPAGKGKVTLTWTASSGAEGYLIYGQKNGKYGYVGMTTQGTTFTDTKALYDDYNFYWVFPYVKDSAGNMVPHNTETYVYAKGILTAVTGLKASSVTGGVKLTWNAVSGAEGYLVYGIVAGKPYGYVGMTTKGTTFTDKTASSTEYNYYWVFPYFKDSNGKMIVGQTAKYTYGRAI
jgi:hypothetical protein